MSKYTNGLPNILSKLTDDSPLIATLAPEYNDEFSRGGQLNNANQSNVCYLTHDESDKFKAVLLEDTLGVDVKKKLFVFSPNDAALYTPSNSSPLFKKLGRGVLRHSSVAVDDKSEAKTASCAGYITIENKKITSLSNDSGHFKPSPLHLYIMIRSLDHFIADDAKINVWVGKKTDGDFILEEYSKEDFVQLVSKKLDNLPILQNKVSKYIDELAKHVALQQEQNELALTTAPTFAIQAQNLNSRPARQRPSFAESLEGERPFPKKRSLFPDALKGEGQHQPNKRLRATSKNKENEGENKTFSLSDFLAMTAAPLSHTERATTPPKQPNSHQLL